MGWGGIDGDQFVGTLESLLIVSARLPWMTEASEDAYRKVGGTTPRTGEVDFVRNIKSKATYYYKDAGGRVMQGAITEDAKAGRSGEAI